VYRQEIASAEAEAASLRRKQAAYEERINVVASEWNTLQDDVCALAARAGVAPAASTNDVSHADVKDPFLRRLLQTSEPSVGRKRARDDDDDAKKAKGDEGDASDSDEDGAARAEGGLDADAKKAVAALKLRATAVKATLTTVLDALDAANADAGRDADDVLSATRRRLATLEADHGAAVAELQRLREITTKQRIRNEELGDKLEDVTAEVELLRRSLAGARSRAGEIEGLPPMATAQGARAAAGAAAVAAAAANTPGGGPVPGTPGMTPATVKPGGKTVGGAVPVTPGPPMFDGAEQPADGGGGGGGGGADPVEILRLEGLVAELKGRVDHAGKQLDEQMNVNAKLKSEANKLRDAAEDDSRVSASKPYQALRQQLASATEDAKRFKDAVASLQREGEGLRAELRHASLAASKAESEYRRAQLAEQRVVDVEKRLDAVSRERDDVAFKLSQTSESASRKKLNEERATLLEKLQKENAELRAEATKARSMRKDVDDAKKAAAEAASEAAAARAEAADAKKALEAARGGKAPEDGTPEALADKLAEARRAAAAAESKAKNAEDALEEKSAESEAFMAEMEAIGAAYEEAQTENARLMSRLTERDGTEQQAMTEKVQAQALARKLREEKAGLEAAVAHERGAAVAAANRASRVEAAAAEREAELARAIEETQSLTKRVEEQTNTLMQVQESASEQRAAAESARKRVDGLTDRADADAKAVAAAERRVKQCEEEIAGLKKRNQKLTKIGGSNDEMKEEVDAYKSMMRCSVCNDRLKGVIITRCYHMFCQECIQTRIDNRARKCPGCGAAFAAADVKPIYF